MIVGYDPAARRLFVEDKAGALVFEAPAAAVIAK